MRGFVNIDNYITSVNHVENFNFSGILNNSKCILNCSSLSFLIKRFVSIKYIRFMHRPAHGVVSVGS